MKIGPKYKICRRLGSDVFEKCSSQKFSLSQAKKEKNKKRKGPLSSFGAQLLEKQKVRFSYGISEKQFGNYVQKASHLSSKSPTASLYQILESRLDNVIYRIGLASTRRLARQMVSHGHILVNGIKQRVPSFQVKVGDKISIREGSKKSILFTDLSKKLKNHVSPKWISFNLDIVEAVVKEKPEPEQVGMLNSFNTIFEFYSR